MADTSTRWHPVRWLAYAVGAATFFWVLRSVGSLLKQVQQSGSDQFGGMESLGSGLLPASAVQRTQSLLEVWRMADLAEPGVSRTIGWTALVYTAADLLLIACYLLLLVGIVRWLRELPPAEELTRLPRWALFDRIASSRAAPWLPVGAAAADVAENTVRLLLIRQAFAGHPAPDRLVYMAWAATTAKFVLLGLSVAVILLLIRDRGLTRGAWRDLGWALWRLRVPLGATLLFAGLLLGDPTGQAADLIRRWLDSWPDALIGAAAIVGAVLLGLAVWLVTRRIVLSDQTVDDHDDGERRRRERWMGLVWLGVGTVAAVVAIIALGWKIDRNTLLILIVAVVLLSAAVYLPALGKTSPRRAVRVVTDWRTILLVAVIAAWAVSGLAGWRELRAPATVATVVLVLEALAFLGSGGGRRILDRLRRRSAAETAADASPDRRSEYAEETRTRDLGQPNPRRSRITRRTARVVAVTAPVALLIATAGALAPVPLVLRLSGDRPTERFWYSLTAAILVLAAPVVVAVAGYLVLRALDRRPGAQPGAPPRPLERRYQIFVPVMVLGAALGLIGGAAHWPAVGPISIVAAFLATAIIALGEAQLRSERRPAPPSFLLAGFTRVPPLVLLVLCGLVAGFAYSDGSGHAVFRAGTLPAQLAATPYRAGVDLPVAFREWVTRNCAGAGHQGSVPLILVSAPGGGLRAAYWTASTLTDMFGPTAAPRAGCTGAAPSDRVFAIGGASGGSLGGLAWIGGLNRDVGRDTTWYDTQLARPDFLSDPLAWLLTVDLVRSYLGFSGQDRARRLENRWSQQVPGLGGDFFAGTWGLGGTRPLPLLTGTQVETGCRLNVSGVRVTDPKVHAQESSCTTVHEGAGQTDAPATSDLLDYLCGPERGSGQASVSRSTAALLSARFPWVSPSGQLNRCADPVEGQGTGATRIAVVDGGYADNTGMGLLLDLWPHLSRLVAAHNAAGGGARIVPVFLEVDNHYAAVAAPATPDRTVETLVPPLTRGRPDQLDDLTMRAHVEAMFAGPVPGTAETCRVDPVAGRYVRVSPRISPGLPAPLAWTLSETATQDLRRQRAKALAEDGPDALRTWTTGTAPPGC